MLSSARIFSKNLYGISNLPVSVILAEVLLPLRFPQTKYEYLYDLKMEDIKATSDSEVIVAAMDSPLSPASPELKHDHGVVLIPRPSDDPRDPLVC